MPSLNSHRGRPIKIRQLRRLRKICSGCGERTALFQPRRRIRGQGRERLGGKKRPRTDKLHDLCGQCRRDMVNSKRRVVDE